MKKFEIEKVASNGATYVIHNLEPSFKMLVIKNDNHKYDKFGDVYELFQFRGNTFALVVDEATAPFNFDDIQDFSHIRSIIKRAWRWYKSQTYIEKFIPKEKQGIIEDDKYLLRQSNKPDHWVCFDKNTKIMIVWKDKLFNQTQEASDLEDLKLSVSEIALSIREMTDWLIKNHKNKLS